MTSLSSPWASLMDLRIIGAIRRSLCVSTLHGKMEKESLLFEAHFHSVMTLKQVLFFAHHKLDEVKYERFALGFGDKN